MALDSRHFWDTTVNRITTDRAVWRRAMQALVQRIMASDEVALFEVLEMGVPTAPIDLIAGATNEPVTRALEVMGVAPTTFKR